MESCDCSGPPPIYRAIFVYFFFFGSWVLATYFIFPHSTITWLPLFLIVGRAVAAIQTKILDNV